LTVLLWIILFCFIGGILSVLAASVFLALRENTRRLVLPHLVSYAIGALLGAAFLGLLPHAINNPTVTDVHDITLTVLIGILTFFILEKFVLWRHCHSLECEAHGPETNAAHEGHKHSHNDEQKNEHNKSAGTLVLVGDGVHNFVDGVLIAAAFLTDVHLGIVTAIAVAAHEIPQEVADFAILLQSGFSRTKALVFNVLSSLTTVVGGVLAYYSLKEMESLLPFILAIAAASFIYVAVADLIPSLHKKTDFKDSIQQITLITLGVITILSTHSLLH